MYIYIYIGLIIYYIGTSPNGWFLHAQFGLTRILQLHQVHCLPVNLGRFYRLFCSEINEHEAQAAQKHSPFFE